MTARRALALGLTALLPLVLALPLLVALPAASDPTTATTSTPAARGQARPNIVLFLVDDMRADEMKFMPKTRRWIGQGGVTFDNSFAPNPLCCPARSSILTGLYTHSHQVYSSAAGFGFHAFRDGNTLPVWLRRAGYRTNYLGKYLNGYGPKPPHGRDSGKSLHYVPPGWTNWLGSIDGGLPASDPDNGGTYRFMDTTLSDNGRGFRNYAGRYQTDVYGDLARGIVRRQAPGDRPFFLHLSFAAPHHGGPVEPDDPPRQVRSDGKRYRIVTTARPPRVRGMFDDVITESPGHSWNDPDFSDKPRYLRNPALTDREWRAVREAARQRAEALWVVDQQVDRVMTALRSSGDLSNTLVMFTSDNGYFLGEQRKRQNKAWPHEPALRVPMLVRGPGIPQGEVRHDPITSIDLAPTFAAAARVETRADVEGVSLLGVARNGDRGWTRAILTESGPRFGIRRGTDLNGGPREPGERGDPRFLIGVRTPRYLYVDVATGEEELYDLQVDPKEYANVADDPGYADVRALLRAELQRVRGCERQACAAPMDPALQGPAG